MPDATLVFPLLGTVIAALGMPLWIGMVPPNRYYGVRAAAVADEAMWYAVNKAAGRDLVAVGGLTLVLSTWLLSTDIGGVAYAIVMSVVLGAGAALIIAVGIARARRL